MYFGGWRARIPLPKRLVMSTSRTWIIETSISLVPFGPRTCNGSARPRIQPTRNRSGSANVWSAWRWVRNTLVRPLHGTCAWASRIEQARPASNRSLSPPASTRVQGPIRSALTVGEPVPRSVTLTMAAASGACAVVARPKHEGDEANHDNPLGSDHSDSPVVRRLYRTRRRRAVTYLWCQTGRRCSLLTQKSNSF